MLVPDDYSLDTEYAKDSKSQHHHTCYISSVGSSLCLTSTECHFLEKKKIATFLYVLWFLETAN